MLNKLLHLVSGLKRGKYFCPVCKSRIRNFVPLPEYYSKNACKYGYVHFGHGEMTALKTYSCPECGASDRERLYAYWIDSQIRQGKFVAGINLLHFAPERALSKSIRDLKYFKYETADLWMKEVDHHFDISNIPRYSESVDFLLCSHVLEHVENDVKAISELYRILRKGGRGILMVPIINGLGNTLEDPSINSEAERWKYYGQGDHLRLYARSDYVKKIKSAGFLVEELDINYFGKNTYSRLGLKETSILYIVSKS